MSEYALKKGQNYPEAMAMVLILDGNFEHVPHAWRKNGFSLENNKNPISDCSRSNLKP